MFLVQQLLNTKKNMTFPYSNSQCSVKNVLEQMLINTLAVAIKKVQSQLCYFYDAIGKMTVLKLNCYIIRSLNN